jgi:hypothetical protein
MHFIKNVSYFLKEVEPEEAEIDLQQQQQEAWLRDQAERGRARQKAALQNGGFQGAPISQHGDRGQHVPLTARPGQQEPVLRKPEGCRDRCGPPEKESSRDSAYGYSADSRITTR